MNALKTIFSAVQTEGDPDSLAELRYDDVVRVRRDSTPGGQPLGGAQRLLVQGGPIGLTCTEPKCLSGVPPVAPGTPCSIEIQMPMLVTPADGRLVLLAGANNAKIRMPVLDAPADDDALCGALSDYRALARMRGCVAFHIYVVLDVLEANELAGLKGKLIALPIPMCANAAGPA